MMSFRYSKSKSQNLLWLNNEAIIGLDYETPAVFKEKDGKNETCVEPCINDYILRQDPQVSPLGCYVFNNNSSIDTFNGLATLNNPSTSPGLSFPEPYNN
ncbi:unnamed protein product [Rhizophagus irregularis]|uniref:Uncharacterized protein n=1 Tax=Rhizophagus irregularis TaxID=588596 RepID=A0A915Z798_9GLOM|nr:unnamed protein product [Rhizophagus irregularis]CAB5210648.1 unnamed protein product [Rhizophagus irregularis]CAB5365231.1 unnamed protein product [Rhizophagus irregularis]